jgi:hypothetical protein
MKLGRRRSNSGSAEGQESGSAVCGGGSPRRHPKQGLDMANSCLVGSRSHYLSAVSAPPAGLVTRGLKGTQGAAPHQA